MELQVQEIQNKIYELRGRKVMLDFDLAEIYDVETSGLKRAVRRNIERFPNDFMFELTQAEYNNIKMNMRCQIGTSNNDGHRGGIRYMPFAFTEQGVAMLSGVLRSSVAVQANINIMRAFVAVREYLLAHASISVELSQLRERVLRLEQTTEQLARADEDNLGTINDLSEDMSKEFDTVYNAIAALSIKLPQLNKPRPRIGYKRGDE